jgi:MFS transporter, OFA family, oxalate/formate antiporter
VTMPLIAQLAMRGHGWRAGWIAIGVTVLAVGFVPVWLLLVRRPEDLGLLPHHAAVTPVAARDSPAARHSETTFSRRQAVRTPAFWLLLGYTVLVYPVQAGVSLHQAANLIEGGVAPTMAASIVSLFSLMSGVASALCGLMPRRLPIRYPMALGGVFLTTGCVAMIGIASARQGAVAAALFGLGIGGMLTLLPIAWADYFGRANYGAIRGLALSAQVLAQAAGPLLSGALHDWTGSYTRSLEAFAALSFLSILAALAARRPRIAPA